MYTLQFADMMQDFFGLLYGAWRTLLLAVFSGVLGFGFAVMFCWMRSWGLKSLNLFITTVVEFVRNTPFIAQIFFVFFGFPAFGIRLTPDKAGLVVMVVNICAYSTEIIRGGAASIDRGYWEAAYSLGLGRTRTFFSILLPPAIQAVYPSLVSQFILLMLGSSVLSTISTTELTSVANDIQNMNFRTTETYLLAACLYLVLSTCLTMALRRAEPLFFPFARLGR